MLNVILTWFRRPPLLPDMQWLACSSDPQSDRRSLIPRLSMTRPANWQSLIRIHKLCKNIKRNVTRYLTLWLLTYQSYVHTLHTYDMSNEDLYFDHGENGKYLRRLRLLNAHSTKYFSSIRYDGSDECQFDLRKRLNPQSAHFQKLFK